jgi:hypothetical protein
MFGRSLDTPEYKAANAEVKACQSTYDHAESMSTSAQTSSAIAHAAFQQANRVLFNAQQALEVAQAP